MINDKVLGIILGGGQGSRLYPLTKDRSKPAVPIAGKYRLVDIPISNCINSDIKRMYVLTQFNSASLNAHIKNTYHFSFFSSAFVDVLAAEQTIHSDKWFQGTADAVRQSMHHFLANDFEYALILSGDQLYQMDFNDMIQKHEESGAEISIATYPVNAKDATQFGLLKTNEENVITSFIEKPGTELLPNWTSDVGDEMKSQGRDYLASMGIYIFNRDLLIKLMDNPDTNDFGKEIIPQAIAKHKTLSYQYEGYWTDIGNIDSFFEANLGLTDDVPQFNLYDNKGIYTRARVLPTSKISGTILNKAVIGDGCLIHAEKIERSVIGIRSRIGKNSLISNTYMMGNDSYESLEQISKNNIEIVMGIGNRCYIHNCIVDKNCRIGDDVRINGGTHIENIETDSYMVKDGIVVIKKDATIPVGTIIG
ncbi:glucose-1-phosphate adenylyltransferase [Polaribacter sp. Hel1_33_78]|jgi:glucose-1-phosphate adenylyltransferase|uniref:glucose-1-phosphate adenylyltransferase n=1 Tax=unclassified Polaribacter TaxID=196858 RepID=UPI00052BE5CF|nr:MULTISPECIES: glucose-1-phosphate adenylyltransferase [unclassified Polaribacter]KGL61330.1 glucose-1-phosphate adenylyltransferase [Polaribacter sp. Hel1_33_49]MBT3742842.1 glucose-1-phosphate adenylyltransferase [Polaribacter sp.]MBT4414379.1 glucose-1-phosphate adenylyltransferase [Polaribacter sp.]MBT7816780.1 glucose-1-phosphate adenylyltransferase [Polaribacter sp.]MDG1196147.1 glucose-1-phosphate adenylyltransferase [Polaribacter sp.]